MHQGDGLGAAAHLQRLLIKPPDAILCFAARGEDGLQEWEQPGTEAAAPLPDATKVAVLAPSRSSLSLWCLFNDAAIEPRQINASVLHLLL